MSHDNFKSGWQHGPGVCGGGSLDEYINLDANEFMFLIALAATGKPVINEAGCGDLFWLRNHYAFFEHFVDYRGYELNARELHENCDSLQFEPNFDICTRVMRPCDIILSRLVFIHLPNSMIAQALVNFRATGAKFLIASAYSLSNNDSRQQAPSYVGQPYDLTQAPFNLEAICSTGRNALFAL